MTLWISRTSGLPERSIPTSFSSGMRRSPNASSCSCESQISLTRKLPFDLKATWYSSPSASRVDARLPVEAAVPDHQTAFLLRNDDARPPPLDIGLLPQLSEPATEEMLHSRVDRAAGSGAPSSFCASARRPARRASMN